MFSYQDAGIDGYLRPSELIRLDWIDTDIENLKCLAPASVKLVELRVRSDMYYIFYAFWVVKVTR